MASTPPELPSARPAQYEIRRRHDGGLISCHCCAANAREALEDLALADLMGPMPPGPGEWAEADVIDTASGASVACTGGLVQPNGEPPAAVHVYF